MNANKLAQKRLRKIKHNVEETTRRQKLVRKVESKVRQKYPKKVLDEINQNLNNKQQNASFVSSTGVRIEGAGDALISDKIRIMGDIPYEDNEGTDF